VPHFGIVRIHSLPHQPEPQQPSVELEIHIDVGSDRRDVMQAVNLHRASSQLLDRREPVHVFAHPFADREDHVDDRFLADGVLERPRVQGVVTRVG
jgi:hypothetical protein